MKKIILTTISCIFSLQTFALAEVTRSNFNSILSENGDISSASSKDEIEDHISRLSELSAFVNSYDDECERSDQKDLEYISTKLNNDNEEISSDLAFLKSQYENYSRKLGRAEKKYKNNKGVTIAATALTAVGTGVIVTTGESNKAMRGMKSVNLVKCKKKGRYWLQHKTACKLAIGQEGLEAKTEEPKTCEDLLAAGGSGVLSYRLNAKDPHSPVDKKWTTSKDGNVYWVARYLRKLCPEPKTPLIEKDGKVLYESKDGKYKGKFEISTSKEQTLSKEGKEISDKLKSNGLTIGKEKSIQTEKSNPTEAVKEKFKKWGIEDDNKLGKFSVDKTMGKTIVNYSLEEIENYKFNVEEMGSGSPKSVSEMKVGQFIKIHFASGATKIKAGDMNLTNLQNLPSGYYIITGAADGGKTPNNQKLANDRAQAAIDVVNNNSSNKDIKLDKEIYISEKNNPSNRYVEIKREAKKD